MMVPNFTGFGVWRCAAFQIAAYCGAPAGIAAKRALAAVRAEEAARD